MQKSKFNILFSENGNNYLFNTYSKKFVQLKKETYEIVKDLLDAEDIRLNENRELENKLLEYGFLVEDETRESLESLRQQCEELVMGETLHITMMMTYNCNLKCVYCFQKHIKNSFMSNATIESVKDFIRNEISKNHIKRLYVEWFGGEPLIYKERLIYLHKEFRKIAKEFKIPYYSRITTNGYELDINTFMELYQNHCFIYYISLDGLKDIQDKQRPHKSGKGSYDVIINNLKMIHKLVKTNNFRIEVRVNCMLSSLANLNEFILNYKELFECDERFALVLDIVQNWGEKTECMQDDLIDKKLLVDIANFAKQNNVALANFTLDSLETQICQAAKKNAYSIFYDGNIIKCQMALEQPLYSDVNVVGHVVNGVIEEKMKKWVNHLIPEECENCIALPLCYGKKCVFQTNIKKEACVGVREKLVSQIHLEQMLNEDLEVI